MVAAAGGARGRARAEEGAEEGAHGGRGCGRAAGAPMLSAPLRIADDLSLKDHPSLPASRPSGPGLGWTWTCKQLNEAHGPILCHVCARNLEARGPYGPHACINESIFWLQYSSYMYPYVCTCTNRISGSIVNSTNVQSVHVCTLRSEILHP